MNFPIYCCWTREHLTISIFLTKTIRMPEGDLCPSYRLPASVKSSACSGWDLLVPGTCGKVSVRLAGFCLPSKGSRRKRAFTGPESGRRWCPAPLRLAPTLNPSVLCRTSTSSLTPPTLCRHHTLGQPSEVQSRAVALAVCLSRSTFLLHLTVRQLSARPYSLKKALRHRDQC